jgi:hypothetical protein
VASPQKPVQRECREAVHSTRRHCAGPDRPGEGLDQHHQSSESQQDRRGLRRPPGDRIDDPVPPCRATESSSKSRRFSEQGHGLGLCLMPRHSLLFEAFRGGAEMITRLLDDPPSAQPPLGGQGISKVLQPLVDGFSHCSPPVGIACLPRRRRRRRRRAPRRRHLESPASAGSARRARGVQRP